MLLSDAYVIEPIREDLFESIQSRAFAHGGGNGHHPLVLLRDFDQRIDRQARITRP